MTETEQTLRQRFTAFLQAMYDWETQANRVDEEEVEKKKTLSWEDFCKVYAGMNYKREYKYKLVEDRWLLDTIKEQYLPENRAPEKWKSVII